MLNGKVIEWNDLKGFGFISLKTEESKVFFHISKVKGRHRRPEIGDEVRFDMSIDEKGRCNAHNVTISYETIRRAESERSSYTEESIPASLYFCATYLILIVAAIMILDGEILFMAAYLLMSVITYTMYAADKSSAQNGSWRTPENTLHIVSLLGGWPGALFAQHQLRHKTRKQPFKSILWMTIFANIIFIGWSFTPEGSQLIKDVLSYFS